MPDILTRTGDRAPGAAPPFAAPAGAPEVARRSQQIPLQAHIALVAQALDPAQHPAPGPTCAALRRHLVEAGHASVITALSDDGTPVTVLRLLGIPARATGSDYALFSNWLSEAGRRLAAMCNA